MGASVVRLNAVSADRVRRRFARLIEPAVGSVGKGALRGTRGGNQTSNGTLTTEYGGANRLIQIQHPLSSIQYTYNGDGLRVWRTANGQTTRYTWDLAAGLPQLLSDGEMLYIRGVGQYRDGEWAYTLADGLGSVRQLADGRGYIVRRYDYSPFGQVVAAEGEWANPLQYTGEQWDADVGLLYLRARWYDPAVGRFTTPDPFPGFVFFPQTQHAYVYVVNNPVKHTDPSGHLPLLLTAALGAAIGGAVNAAVQVHQIRRADPSLTLQEAVGRIDAGQVVGAAAAGGFMGLTLGIGAGGVGTAMILGAVGGGLGGQVGALAEATWDEAIYMWYGCGVNAQRFIQTARSSGFGDFERMGVDAFAGAVSAGVGYQASSLVGRWILLPGGGSSAPIRQVVAIHPRAGIVVMQDLGRTLALPMGPTEQLQVYLTDIIYEAFRGVLEELLQTGVGEWVENPLVQ